MYRLMNKKHKNMDWQTLIILIAIGLSAGMLGGLVGIGGGIVIVPALIYFLDYTQKQAQGSSLGLLLLPLGILGFLQYYTHCQKSGTPIDFKVIGIMGIGFLIGNFFGSKVAIKIDQEILKKIFAVFIILIGLKMLFLDKKIEEKKEIGNEIRKN
jgi:uncharacterized membrane protein YfcA